MTNKVALVMKKTQKHTHKETKPKPTGPSSPVKLLIWVCIYDWVGPTSVVHIIQQRTVLLIFLQTIIIAQILSSGLRRD